MIFDEPKSPIEELINYQEALNNTIKSNIELLDENYNLKIENKKLNYILSNLNNTNITKKE